MEDYQNGGTYDAPDDYEEISKRYLFSHQFSLYKQNQRVGDKTCETEKIAQLETYDERD